MSTEPLKNPLLSILRAYFLPIKGVVLSSMFVLFIAATELVNPWLVMRAIDSMIGSSSSVGNPNIDERFNGILVISGIITSIVLSQYLARYCLAKIQNRIIYSGAARLRSELYERLMGMSLNFHNQHRVGDILSHLVADIQTLQDAVLDLVSELPFDCVSIAGLLALMFFLNSWLAGIVTSFLVLTILFSVFLGRRGIKVQAMAMDNAAAMSSQIQESLNSVRTIQAFGAGGAESNQLSEVANNHAAALQAAGETRAVVTPVFSLAEYAGILIVLTVGGWCVLHGTLTTGGLVAFLAYMEMAADPMSRGAQMLPKVQRAMVCSARLSIALQPPSENKRSEGILKPLSLKGQICLKNVGYSYPNSVRPALENLNLIVQPGETVAIVGANAAGKSTLIDILLKLQCPDQGIVEIDGIDLQEISDESWCRFVGLIPQEILLLNRTISENISLGMASSCDARDAATMAGLDEAIMRLPRGYETVPGERGVCLSGGERQRVAIARLFLRNPRILLLDEPTSSLDVRSEKELLPSLKRLCVGRTTFIVSHRIPVLESADKVLLLSGGRQLAFDTPTAVYNRFSIFRDLFPESWNAINRSPILEKV